MTTCSSACRSPAHAAPAGVEIAPDGVAPKHALALEELEPRSRPRAFRSACPVPGAGAPALARRSGIVQQALHDPLDPLDGACASRAVIADRPRRCKHLDIGAQGAERIPDLVRHAGGEPADAGQLLDPHARGSARRAAPRPWPGSGRRAGRARRSSYDRRRTREIAAGEHIGLGGQHLQRPDDRAGGPGARRTATKTAVLPAQRDQRPAGLPKSPPRTGPWSARPGAPRRR